MRGELALNATAMKDKAQSCRMVSKYEAKPVM
jgi:hypothetical protein